jgi:hypothetical protein
MNTIIDLNAVANISYNNESSYAISFGANAGNTTANVDAYTTANITKQTTLTSITDAVRDLLIDVQFSNVGNVSMAYTGTYSNIGLLQIAPAAWRVNGIRSVPQYNEAFANVKYSDLTGSSAVSPEYSYLTTVNDQSGNTRSWTTTVNVLVQPVINITGPVIYNEDTITNVTVANVVVDPASTAVFRMFANTVPTYGSMTDGIVTGNSVFIDGNAASLNSQIAAGGIKFWPASDFVSNVANAINIQLVSGTTTVGTANANIQIGSQDSEYSLTTSYDYAEDNTVQMVFDITDQDSRPNISYVSTFTQTSGPTSQFYVNGVAQGYGNSAVVANTKANINVANVSFLPYPDSTANVGLAYTQVKVMPTGNTTQASNIAISLTNTSSHNDYSLTTSYNFAEDNTVQMVFDITDTDPRAQSYTSTFAQSSGPTSQFIVNGIAQGYGNSAVLTGNITTINVANVSFSPYPDSTANVGLTYTQTKLNVFGNTDVQASNVAISLVNNVSHDDYNIPGNVNYNNDIDYLFNNFSITDLAINKNYQVTLNIITAGLGELIAANGVSTGNTLTISGSKSSVNSSMALSSFRPAQDSIANGVITYSQLQTTDNIQQASNVAVAFNGVRVSDFSYYADLGNQLLLSSVSLSGVAYIYDPLQRKTFTWGVSTRSPGSNTNPTTVLKLQSNNLSDNSGATGPANSLTNFLNVTQWQAGSNYFSNNTLYAVVPGTKNLNMIVTQDLPSSRSIANVNISMNVVDPTVGSTWRGGTYLGKYLLNQSGYSWIYVILADSSVETSQRFRTNTNPTNGPGVMQDGGDFGETNTEYYVNYTSNDYQAAKAAFNLVHNGYSDWYLPAKRELALYPAALGASKTYWTSSFNPFTDKLIAINNAGTITNYDWGGTTTTTNWVRPVRYERVRI